MLHSSLVVGTGAGAQVRPPPEHGGDEEQEVDDVRGDADHAQVVYDVHEQVGEVRGADVGQHS